MSRLETIAERFVAAEPEGFFDELRTRAEADAVRRAKRWRATAAALAVVAVAAIGAAAVLAARSGSSAAATGTKTVDRTLACGLHTSIGNGFNVYAHVNEPPNGFLRPAQLGVSPSGPGLVLPTYAFAATSKLLSVASPNGKRVLVTTGYLFDDTVCQKSASIPLAPSGLPSLGAFSLAGHAEFGMYCPLADGTPIFVRLRVTVRAGVPQAGQLAVRVGRHRRPVAFVNWTQTHFTAYGSSGCFRP